MWRITLACWLDVRYYVTYKLSLSLFGSLSLSFLPPPCLSSFLFVCLSFSVSFASRPPFALLSPSFSRSHSLSLLVSSFPCLFFSSSFSLPLSVLLFFFSSAWAHLLVVGMSLQTSRACPLFYCVFVCFCLYRPFNCISFHEFSRQLSAFSLCFSDLISALLVLSTICLFSKVSLSPDMILCG